mmetsp:Transcript_50172/g.76340  ORF Transcript_50172/g.76340 Transcript_50172/m.76340 type:complete len:175 (+) Transcript_50172:59-583(+)|eukprot:CAMPEP_0117011878 /NCGR_PEP_ID=MMETSP0472-20121206/10120_1 /TAXON_ID=693140 ORGANISM="Tiarina fusus, Strain LIS" /NCGR_SAMPLE_ID=MMETSP0472 /ASSEMBLY_ACC=CAM_ASM_000603 /LENGTH=174 /DNA_ID=CAMNT_0004714811 /DNA_START=59 /DNA_END=583 /DNA_ORIENTATION=-
MAANTRKRLLLWTLLIALIWVSESFQFFHQKRRVADGNIDVSDFQGKTVDRRKIFQAVGMAFFVVSAAPKESLAVKSYSSNARNMERMNSGDMSGGSVYDNNPKSDAGKRRRAMVGCKTNVAREEAAEKSLNSSSLSEKDCNQMVLGGDTEFMLQALRTLECPSCPYGISSTRK